MSKPSFLAAVTGRGAYEVKRAHKWNPPQYNLWLKGARFPLAGGDMGHLMKVYARLRVGGTVSEGHGG